MEIPISISVIPYSNVLETLLPLLKLKISSLLFVKIVLGSSETMP